MSTLSLKRVGSDHKQLVLDWRNDENTRAASFEDGTISQEAHHQWFTRLLIDTRTWARLATFQEVPVGFAIFKETLSQELILEYEISINLNPEFRGKGYGTKVLNLCLAGHREEYGFRYAYSRQLQYKARVKDCNIPSLKVFLACGFEVASKQKKVITLYRSFP